MQDDGQGVPGELVSIAKKGQGNLLGFSLEFREGTALVSLSDRKFKDRIQVERLSLEVPDVSFPFDVSGGPNSSGTTGAACGPWWCRSTRTT